MSIQEYRGNRSRFSAEELQQYEGDWVAFSADGCRIVASARDIAALHSRLAEAGVGPEQVKLERIILDDDWQGAGSEFG